MNYWRGGSYHGLGPSASGYVRQVRTTNWANIDHYCEELEQGRRPIQIEDRLPPLQRAGEIAAFGLRMTAGWPFALFKAVTGFDLQSEWAKELLQLQEWGWGQTDHEGFRLTPAGLRFADPAGELLLR